MASRGSAPSPCRTSPITSVCPRRWCRWCSATRRARAPRPASACWRPRTNWATGVNRAAALMSAAAVTPHWRYGQYSQHISRRTGRGHRRRGRRLRLRGRARRRHTDAWRTRRSSTPCSDFRCEALILLGPELGDDAVTEFARQGAGCRRRQAHVRQHRSTSYAPRTGAASDKWSTTSSSWGTAASAISAAARHIPCRPQSGLCARHEATRAIGRDRHHRRRLHRAAGHACRAAAVAPTTTARPRCVPPTTAAPSGCSTSCAEPAIDVPGDIAVAGYDDSMLAQARTHRPDHRQPGTATAGRDAPCRAVVERLDENREDRFDILLEPRLVVRHTTAPQVRRPA